MQAAAQQSTVASLIQMMRLGLALTPMSAQVSVKRSLS